MDTPPWVYRWIYRAPGLNGLAKATLGFCGIAPVRRTIFGPVKGSSEAVRRRWIAQARQEGARLAGGALTRGASIRRQIAAWIAALRLQFHPMAWIAYLIGALGAWHAAAPSRLHRSGWDWPVCSAWKRPRCLPTIISIRRATGSTGIMAHLPADPACLSMGGFHRPRCATASLWRLLPSASSAPCCALMTPWPMAPFLIGNAILAIGYTVPPLQLCWRGLGEIDVALTHSFSALLCGSLAQGRSHRGAISVADRTTAVLCRIARHHSVRRAGFRCRPCQWQA